MGNKSRKTSGTKEWVDKTYNTQKGCMNNCSYCYAKRLAKMGAWIPSNGWDKPIYNWKNYHKNISKFYENGIMYPSSHDITERNIMVSHFFIKRLLKESKNNILLVSKPRLSVINFLVNDFEATNAEENKKRIQFRFSITSINNKLIKEYEPNASLFEERLSCLKYVFDHGFKNSVSIEPFLDENPIPLIKKIAPFVNDSIWIGTMSGRKYKYHTKKNLTTIYNKLNQLPIEIYDKLRLKDGYSNKGFNLARLCPKCKSKLKHSSRSLNIIDKLPKFKLNWECSNCSFPENNKESYQSIKNIIIK